MRSLFNYRYFLSSYFFGLCNYYISGFLSNYHNNSNSTREHYIKWIILTSFTFHNFAYFSFILLLSLELISLLVMLYLCSYKFCLKRRLRIRTLQYRPASNISEIYDSVDPEVVLHILVHKVILFSSSNIM